MESCKPVSTPCEDIIDDQNCEPIFITLYKCAIGSLTFCMIYTRPDLNWVVTKLSQCNKPSENHWQSVKRVLRYIQAILIED